LPKIGNYASPLLKVGAKIAPSAKGDRKGRPYAVCACKQQFNIPSKNEPAGSGWLVLYSKLTCVVHDGRQGAQRCRLTAQDPLTKGAD